MRHNKEGKRKISVIIRDWEKAYRGWCKYEKDRHNNEGKRKISVIKRKTMNSVREKKV